MRPKRIIVLMAVMALVLAACSPDDAADTTEAAAPDTTEAAPDTTEAAPDTTEGASDTTEAPSDDNPLAAYGEDPTAADPALVEKALGPVQASDQESWNIVLASIARANQDLDQATIDKAMECWSAPECDTGSGGDLVMGYADGAGHLNVWRGVTHMEAILQALTYPEIGKIVSTEGLWAYDPTVQQGNLEYLIQYPVDFIIGYPDYPELVYEQIAAAGAAGIPYVPFSGGWVGLPGVHDFALTPGDDYLSVVGEDLCALGESFSDVLNDNVGDGKIGVLGGSAGNGLTLGWQRCHIPTFNGTVVNPPAGDNQTTGDTNWLNDQALQVVSGMLSTDPDIAGFSYEYADGINTALRAYDDLGIPFPESLTLALRTDEMTLFCDWVDRSAPGYRIFYSAGGNFQSRTALTAVMMSLQGADVPAELIVPHVMREVTADDCDPNAPTPTVSGTSLVPGEVLQLMFGS